MPAPLEAIAPLIAPEFLAESLAAAKWTQAKEMKRLVKIAQGDNDSQAMQAIRLIHEHIKDSVRFAVVLRPAALPIHGGILSPATPAVVEEVYSASRAQESLEVITDERHADKRAQGMGDEGSGGGRGPGESDGGADAEEAERAIERAGGGADKLGPGEPVTGGCDARASSWSPGGGNLLSARGVRAGGAVAGADRTDAEAEAEAPADGTSDDAGDEHVPDVGPAGSPARRGGGHRSPPTRGSGEPTRICPGGTGEFMYRPDGTRVSDED